MPTLPTLSWDMDFTTATYYPMFWLNGDLVKMFGRAIRERTYATTPVSSPAAYVASDLVLPLAGDPGMNWWSAAKRTVDALAGSFVRYYQSNSGSTPYTWAGAASIDSCRYTGTPDVGFTPTMFPSGGWTRRFTRCIYSRSQTGTAGQRARLTATAPTGSTWYSCLTTDPLFNTTVTTPSGDVGFSGKYFVYGGSGWALATDQTSDSDMIVETGVIADVAGDIVFPGDILDGNYLNELRDAINQLTKTLGALRQFPDVGGTAYYTAVEATLFASPGDIPMAPVNDPVVAAGLYAGNIFTGVEASSNDSPPTGANAQANYTAAVGGTFIADVAYPVPSNISRFTAWTSGYGYLCHCGNSRIVDRSDVMLVPGGGMTRQVSFWTVPVAQIAGYGTGNFDAMGDSVTENVWCQHGSSHSSAAYWNALAVTGNSGIGNCLWSDRALDLSSVPDPFPPSGQTRGWAPDQVAIICDYEVSAGFTYVNGYSGT